MFFYQKQRLILIFICCLALFPFEERGLAADEKEEVLPRFVSLRVSSANLRTGPGERFPIEWVYQKKGLPVELLKKYDIWRKIRDYEGTEGWVHRRMLTDNRTVMTQNADQSVLYDEEDPSSAIIAFIDPMVIGRLQECPNKSLFCKVAFPGATGWILRENLYGLYPAETIE